MNYIDSKFRKAKEDVKEARLLKKMFSNPALQEKINNLYEDYFVYNNHFPTEDWEKNRIGEIANFDKANKKIQLLGAYIDNRREYEDLLDKLNDQSYITYDNEIMYHKYWKTTFSGYEIYIFEVYAAKIPEEELKLLDSLGKVEYEHIVEQHIPKVVCRA